jgi:hypothetical protein
LHNIDLSEANLIRCTIIIGVNVATRCTLRRPLLFVGRGGKTDINAVQFILLASLNTSFVFFARGIVAEPATKARRAELADGADSPTRAANAHKCAHKCQRHAVEAHAVEAFASEAARPTFLVVYAIIDF